MITRVLCIFVLVAIATVIASPVENDKPAFSCPQDEEYYKCSQLACYKICEHLKPSSAPACPIVSADCYHPACECKQDHVRNEKGVCIPYSQCPKD